MIYRFRVYGQVRGQGRPRMRRNGHVYKDAKSRKYEDKIKSEYINGGGVYFGDRPISMRIVIHRALPKSKPKRIMFEADTHKPDASNVLKAVEDALNGIAYKDDSQIVKVIVVKKPRERIDCEYIDVYLSDEC